MFKVDVKVELKNIPQKVNKASKYAQYVLDEAALKDSNNFIPADTWNLRDSSLIHSKIGEGHLEWQTKYARKLYYNPNYDFSKDKNPNARGMWFEEAKAQHKQSWISQANRAMKSKI